MLRHPNLFIIGAPRCGTTSIIDFLSNSEDVFLPKIKEPFYYSPELYGSKISTQVPIIINEADYADLFKEAADRCWICDASTSYIWTEGTAVSLHEKSPNARIIAIVRHPVDRVFSHYLHYVGRYGEKRPFHEFVMDGVKAGADQHDRHHIESGFYARNLQRYLDVFSWDQLLVLAYDELKHQPEVFFRKIADHLGLDYESMSKSTTPQKNASHAMRKGWAKSLYDLRYRLYRGRLPLPEELKRMFRKELLEIKPDQKTVDFLNELYKKDMEEFERLTGIKFSR